VTPSLRRGWLHLAGGAGVGRIAGLLSNLLLSRLLGPVDLGLFNLVATTVQTGDTLVRLGGDYALNYELGGEPGAFETPRGRALAQAFTQLCGVATGLLCIGLLVWLGPGGGLFPVGLLEPERTIRVVMLVGMVALEAICAVPWELLLVDHCTRRLALRQGFFVPLRLALAAIGAVGWQLDGAMVGWLIVAGAQLVFLRSDRQLHWRPFRLSGLDLSPVLDLLRRGLPFYGANLLASLIFYPLLLQVYRQHGLADIGYLRVGQIVQQLFAFLPATLVPVLFLRLRGKDSFMDRIREVDRPIRMLWLLLLALFFVYVLIDRALVNVLFGSAFSLAVAPTRILLITALGEALLQLVVQPAVASGQTWRYLLVQNGSVLMAAAVAWWLIPGLGLAGFLAARLVYVVLPLLIYLWQLFPSLKGKAKLLLYGLITLFAAAFCQYQLMAAGSGWPLVPAMGDVLMWLALLACLLVAGWDDLLELRLLLIASF
jgi:O-antigen/teichoic acid export membrane protein